MSVKVLSIALIGAIIALPVPASQYLAGTFSAPAPRTAATLAPARPDAFATLIEDPFLVGRLSYTAPGSVLDIGAPASI